MLSMVQRAVESHEQITFGFVDIDDFRDYNTNYLSLIHISEISTPDNFAISPAA